MGKIKDFLNKIWPKFQTYYDRIKAWELSPEVDAIIDEIWDLLDDQIKKAIFDFIKYIYDKYGKKMAEEILENNLRTLKKNRVI